MSNAPQSLVSVLDAVAQTHPHLLDDTAIELLDSYTGLITRWAKASKLVSTGEVGRLNDHVLDSLSLLSCMDIQSTPGPCLLDIGSGAGFPAIPLKLASPSLRLTMVERSAKKCAFLRSVVSHLGLSNVTVVNTPYNPAEAYDQPTWLTCRAIEQPESLATLVSPLIRSGTRLLCQSERLHRALPGDLQESADIPANPLLKYRRGYFRLISAPK